jgi:hypothetical protein
MIAFPMRDNAADWRAVPELRGIELQGLHVAFINQAAVRSNDGSSGCAAWRPQWCALPLELLGVADSS